jgi:3'-phosphoadenosine 5'-phosphosulfate sulfotransferase (PAPS reductase)/FAD synthetase
MKGIGWFSGGVTSAVAIKKALEAGHEVEIFYFETGAHHPDHERFLKDCERWYGQKITTLRNQKYSSPIDVILKDKYINGPSGARCTLKLKKELRFKLEEIIDYDFQVFGFENDRRQIARRDRFIEQYPNAKGIFPLIEAGLNKDDCFRVLLEAGIALPAMYHLGYSNSNCIGCPKGGAGYWNKIRRDFPETFEQMAKAERAVKATCLRRGKRKLYLDELDPEAGRHEDISLPECGVVCQVEMFDSDLLL